MGRAQYLAYPKNIVQEYGRRKGDGVVDKNVAR
jgi:hypothetical protein